MYQRTAHGDVCAEFEFRRAVELDARFAAPLAALAYTRSQALYQTPPDNVLAARMSEAIELANQAIGLDPEDALAYCALGRALYVSRKFDRALEASRTAVQLNPSSATCRRVLGFALLHSGDPKASIPEFEFALKLSPRDPERWSFFLGTAAAHLVQREFEQALVWIERALGAPNPTAWPLVVRAAILGYLGRTEDARAALALALRRMPEASVTDTLQLVSRMSRTTIADVVAEGLAAAGLRYD